MKAPLGALERWRGRKTDGGAGKLATAFVCGIIATIGFVGYNVVPFYYYYFELTNQLHALVATADRDNDAAIRSRVMQIVKNLEIPADERAVQIDRRDGIITIAVPYAEIFYVTFRGKDYDLYRFQFRASAEGTL